MEGHLAGIRKITTFGQLYKNLEAESALEKNIWLRRSRG